MTEDATRKIARARYEARAKWLRKHPEATMSPYGHAQGLMSIAEAGVSEGYSPDDATPEEYLEECEMRLREKYGVDVSVPAESGRKILVLLVLGLLSCACIGIVLVVAR